MQSLEWMAFDRIKHFERQLAKIKTSDFIRKSTESALKVIECAIDALRGDIEEASTLGDKSYLSQKSITVNQKLFSFTNYLGILLRSTNTRNCFEAYFSFSNIVEQLTGHKDVLIISSEWDASPFYIQQPPEVLKNFFFIGFPAFASRNALLLPLAAHEIGHAIWRLNEVEGQVYTTAEYFLNEYLMENKKISGSHKSLFDQIDDEEFLGRTLTLILSQTQEIFCDLFGAYLFKKSYSYAFEQYLAPGFGKRDVAYPSFERRIKYIREAAFEGSDGNKGLIDDSLLRPSMRSLSSEAAAADFVATKIHDSLCGVVKKILAEANLLEYSSEEEIKIFSCLKSGVPPYVATSAIVVLNATWKLYLDGINLLDDVDERHKFSAFINNLCMKSLEIIEYNKLEESI
ncbi:MAG: hypothetical protein P4L61_00180 [Candidatus Pacebacteria bacterium]|nr:hypothetical protein [Candidatus Paceibacterota bacterium]